MSATAIMCSATLRVTPLPRSKGMAILFFDDPAESFEAAAALQALSPVAIEYVDDVLFDQTRGQRAFQPARDFLELDARPRQRKLVVQIMGE